jgi:Bax protein
MINKKARITFNQVKEFLLKKGFILKKKSNKKLSNNDFKALYYTFLSSLSLILIFFLIPIIAEFKKNTIIASKEIENNSKTNFEKVLDKKDLKKFESTDEGLGTEYFEDILEDEVLEDSVRFSAQEIEKLFRETDYNLTNVRKTKLVQPFPIAHLPKEMKIIEGTKKKKNLFIQIILPLIIEENNKVKSDRKRLFAILNKSNNSTEEKKWLNQKFKQYGVLNKDLLTLKVRMDIVPVSLAIAQAAKETGWGKSRFALEGNALFGQWTWSGEGIKPAGADDNTTHKVMKFKILKTSVKAYLRNLNTHSSYKKFRLVRAVLRDNEKSLDSLVLANYLDKYAQTGEQYIIILKKIIKQNNLKDFDNVQLMPSSIQLKSLI